MSFTKILTIVLVIMAMWGVTGCNETPVVNNAQTSAQTEGDRPCVLGAEFYSSQGQALSDYEIRYAYNATTLFLTMISPEAGHQVSIDVFFGSAPGQHNPPGQMPIRFTTDTGYTSYEISWASIGVETPLPACPGFLAHLDRNNETYWAGNQYRRSGHGNTRWIRWSHLCCP